MNSSPADRYQLILLIESRSPRIDRPKTTPRLAPFTPLGSPSQLSPAARILVLVPILRPTQHGQKHQCQNKSDSAPAGQISVTN